MSRLWNPTHPNPLILLLCSCLPDWSSDRYFFSLALPRTLAQQLIATAGTSLEISLLLSPLRVTVVFGCPLSCKWFCCVHKQINVHPDEISLLQWRYCVVRFNSKVISVHKFWLSWLIPHTVFQPCLRRISDSFWAWLLQLVTHSPPNFVIVNDDNRGSDGAFDIWETQCERRRKRRGSWDEGGCHHCWATSKDSWADVSKQDGCQVNLVNYCSNKNRLMFMQHQVPKSGFVVFTTVGSCFLLIFELVLCVFNQINWIFLVFWSSWKARWIYVDRGQ